MAFNDYIFVSPIITENESSDLILLKQEMDHSIFFAQFSCSDDDSNNDGLYADKHLNRGQLYLLDYSEQKNYVRTKRSHTKTHVKRRKKLKYANSMKIKLRDKQLIYERLAKQVELTAPNTDCIPSPQPTLSDSPYLSRLNSYSSEEDYELPNYIYGSSSASSIFADNESFDEIWLEEEVDYSIYFAQFNYPDDDDDDLAFFDDDDNDGLYADNHLNRGQLYSLDYSERKNYQRAKHSSTKTNVKYRKKIKSYIHHRVAKQAEVNLPKARFIPSPQPTSSEIIRSVVVNHQRPSNNNQQQVTPNHTRVTTNQFQEYLINETNTTNEPTFDDVMITFLLEMQNRDLSPNDYEILLRLDERVQPKTVNTNILDSLPTINVNETHLNEQCTICLETYILEQQLKLLPCLHLFHLNCIETYLREFSIQCPLDNIPLI